MRTYLASIACALLLALSACNGQTNVTSEVSKQLTTQTPEQVTTLAEALIAAKLVTDAVDFYVNTGTPSEATLLQIMALNDGVHEALGNLQAANSAGQSLAMAVFKEALRAFILYGDEKGIIK